MSARRIIDISQTLRTGIAVWPGDTEFQSFWMMRMDRGDSCNVGSVTMSLHTGTHADAPLHFLAGGASPDSADLSAYIGPAEVIDLSGARAIDSDQIRTLAAGQQGRLLFRTGTAQADSFNRDFTYFTKGAALEIVKLGAVLVGIDTPSVDKSDSTTLDAHKVFAAANVAVLENLVLDFVTPGRYELVALPLKLAGMDASPIRAILRAL
jgi:arylformamidase